MSKKIDLNIEELQRVVLPESKKRQAGYDKKSVNSLLGKVIEALTRAQAHMDEQEGVIQSLEDDLDDARQYISELRSGEGVNDTSEDTHVVTADEELTNAQSEDIQASLSMLETATRVAEEYVEEWRAKTANAEAEATQIIEQANEQARTNVAYWEDRVAELKQEGRNQIAQLQSEVDELNSIKESLMSQLRNTVTALDN